MADTLTTTYDFVQPEVGASDDSWGTKLNANLAALDALLTDAFTGGTPTDIGLLKTVNAKMATLAEARAGSAADRFIAPADLGARAGFLNSGSLVGLQFYDFTVPAEATEIEVLPDFCGPNIAGAVFGIRVNGVSTGYNSHQSRLPNAAAIVGAENTTGYGVTLPGGTDNVMGAIRLTLQASGVWLANGGVRINSTTQVHLTGRVTGVGALSIIRINANMGTADTFATGSCALRWRI